MRHLHWLTVTTLRWHDFWEGDRTTSTTNNEYNKTPLGVDGRGDFLETDKPQPSPEMTGAAAQPGHLKNSEDSELGILRLGRCG